jgi:hypothetical protein
MLSQVLEFGNELAQIKDLITLQAKQSSVFQDQLTTQLWKLEADQAETWACVHEINQYQHTGERAPLAPVPQQQRDSMHPQMRENHPSMQQNSSQPGCYYCSMPSHFMFSYNACANHLSEGLLVLRDRKMFIKAANLPLPMMLPTGQLVKDFVEQVSGARSVNIQTWNGNSQCFEEWLDHTLTSFSDRLEGLAQQMNFSGVEWPNQCVKWQVTKQLRR